MSSTDNTNTPPADTGCAIEAATEKHQWLHQFVGQWTSEVECCMPDGTSTKNTGTETVRAYGDLWVIFEGKQTMDKAKTDKEMVMTITVGYDLAKKYVGTFVCDTFTKLWVYEGDVEGNKLSLYADGPNFCQPGKTSRYLDETELVDKDTRIFKSKVQLDNGEWVTFVNATYRRVKA